MLGFLLGTLIALSIILVVWLFVVAYKTSKEWKESRPKKVEQPRSTTCTAVDTERGAYRTKAEVTSQEPLTIVITIDLPDTSETDKHKAI